MIFSKLVLVETFQVLDDRWSIHEVVQVRAEVIDHQRKCRDVITL
jgi:hypothetical protein